MLVQYTNICISRITAYSMTSKIMIRARARRPGARAGEHMVQTLALLIISVLISMMENITSFGQQNNDGYTVANNIGKALVSRYLTLCGIPGWGAKAS